MWFTKQILESLFVRALLLLTISAVGCSATRSSRVSPLPMDLTGSGTGPMGGVKANRTPSDSSGQKTPEHLAVEFESTGSHPQGQSSDAWSVKVDPAVDAFSHQELSSRDSSAVMLASQVVLDEESLHEQADRPVLTYEMLENMALGQNPAIQQAVATVHQTRGIRHQVGLKPNPTIGYFGQEIGNEGAGGQHGGFVSQTWIRGDKLDWNRRVLAHDVSASNWQTQVQQQRILTDLRVTYYDYLSAKTRLRLAEDFRMVAEEAVDLAREKLDAEVGTRPDLLQSEIQLSEIDLLIQRAQIDHAAALQSLAALCGVVDFDDAVVAGNEDELMQFAKPTLLDEEAVLADILAGSPELAVARSQVQRACANLHRQKLQPIPNVTTQLGVGADDATGDAFTNLQVSVPIPVHNQNQGNVRAAVAQHRAASQNEERIRMRLRSDLAGALRQYREAEAEVENYHDRILPKAQAALELIRQGKEAGEFDFLRLLTARRMYFDSNIQFVSALTKLAQSKARIDGKLLTNGLSESILYQGDDGLRGQALTGQ